MRGWKNIFHENGKQKKAGVAILISDKIDLKTRSITRDKEGPLHNDQGINPRGRYNSLKYLCTQLGAPQYIRQTLTDIKGEIDSNTVKVGDFNTPPAESATGGWVKPGLVFKWFPLCELILSGLIL